MSVQDGQRSWGVEDDDSSMGLNCAELDPGIVQGCLPECDKDGRRTILTLE